MKKETNLKKIPYEAPQIQTLSSAKVLEVLGPAMAVYGQPGYNEGAW